MVVIVVSVHTDIGNFQTKRDGNGKAINWIDVTSDGQRITFYGTKEHIDALEAAFGSMERAPLEVEPVRPQIALVDDGDWIV